MDVAMNLVTKRLVENLHQSGVSSKTIDKCSQSFQNNLEHLEVRLGMEFDESVEKIHLDMEETKQVAYYFA